VLQRMSEGEEIQMRSRDGPLVVVSGDRVRRRVGRVMIIKVNNKILVNFGCGNNALDV
jgi:hypothetical protein